MNVKWMSNPQYLAQVAHFLGGALLIVLSALFFGWGRPVYWTFGAGLALASAKEFIFDVAKWGEGDSWADSAMDWAFYVLGGLAGLGLAYWAHRLGHSHL